MLSNVRSSTKNDLKIKNPLSIEQSPRKSRVRLPPMLQHSLSSSRINDVGEEEDKDDLTYLYVLPVLLFEFLAIAITRAVLPSKLLKAFGRNVYVIMGVCEFLRGLLAFVACPWFGRISDNLGRKPCLFITVLGTCAPICSLALFGNFSSTATAEDNDIQMWIFVLLLALSGCFSATFTLTFAYISDCVPTGDKRVAAYGLALATFGLSFTIGPMAGGYLARSVNVATEDESATVTIAEEIHVNNEENEHASEAIYHGKDRIHDDDNFDSGLDPEGEQRVFLFSFILTMITLLYIMYYLPETVPSKIDEQTDFTRKQR